MNGFQDDDGCADAAPRVRVAGNEVKINDKIHFAFGEATIEPESQGLLREIALVINNNPQIEHMEVAGHADKMGTDAANVALSKSRAHAVLDALVKLGVNKRRLRSAGYGRYCPIDKADSDDARERNRRVEIKIMRVQGVATGVALGCEEATAASQGKRHASAQPTTAPPMSHFATGRNSPVRKTPSAQAKRSAGPAPRR